MYDINLSGGIELRPDRTPFLQRIKNKLVSAKKAADESKLSTVIVIMAIFVLAFLYMTTHTELFGDDYGYRYVFSKAQKLTDNRVDSLGEVLASQAAHYSLMNGRSVAHTLLQTVLIFGKGFFCLFNTFMYFMLGLGMYLHTRSAPDRKRGQHRPLAMLVVYLLPWLVFPDYGNVYYIESLAANYLWTMTIIIWFMLPFRLLLEGEDIFAGRMRRVPLRGLYMKLTGRYDLPMPMREKPAAVLMLICGLIAGWCSENGSAAMLFALGCMGLWYILSAKRIPLWCWTGFGGAVIGFVIMLCSPGYGIRSEEAAHVGFFDRLSTLFAAHIFMPYGCAIFILLMCVCFLLCTEHSRSQKKMLSLATMAGIATVVMLILNIILAGKVAQAYVNLIFDLAAAVYAVRLLVGLPRKQLTDMKILLPAAYIITALVATLSLIGVPYVQRRSQFPFMVFFTIAFAVIIERTISRLCRTLRLKNAKKLITAAAIVYAFISLFVVSVKTGVNYRQFIDMEQSIYSQKIEGYDEIIIKTPETSGDRRVAGLHMSNNDQSYWINQAFCQYYHIDSVHYEAGDH